ncbi:MAG: nucleotidyltransferase domain-containing protein [Chloroflexi bacterium]|nr:nucleotidyltransferase domain-containing protein [Chloroflexota bacterium]
MESGRSKRTLREVNAPYLIGDKRAALTNFLARLEAEYGDDVWRVILFGSQTRGDADPESDVDLLVVARGDLENARRVNQWCQQNHSPWVSEIVISEQEYQNDQRLKLPFYVTVRREGIELWDQQARAIEEHQTPLDFIEGEPRMLTLETIETIRIYLSNLREQRDEASTLANVAHWRGAISHLYYAAFYITTAALYTVNIVRGKHKGVFDAINQFLVKPDLLEPEYRDIYKRLMEGRLNVDYRPQKRIAGEKILGDDELRQLYYDGERYIEKLQQFLFDRGIIKTDFDG